MLKNTSEALSVVAYGLEWTPGDEVIISNQEFPSNRIVWESLAAQGVKVVSVDIGTSDAPEQAIIDQIGDRTRLVSLSSVRESVLRSTDAMTASLLSAVDVRLQVSSRAARPPVKVCLNMPLWVPCFGAVSDWFRERYKN